MDHQQRGEEGLATPTSTPGTGRSTPVSGTGRNHLPVPSLPGRSRGNVGETGYQEDGKAPEKGEERPNQGLLGNHKDVVLHVQHKPDPLPEQLKGGL